MHILQTSIGYDWNAKGKSIYSMELPYIKVPLPEIRRSGVPVYDVDSAHGEFAVPM